MEKFSNLPKPVQGGIVAGGAGALLVAGMGLGSDKWWIFLLVLVVLLVVLAGGFLIWSALTRKRKNARLGGELQQHSSASPRGISDPGQRARLDDLRKKFEQGVQEYRSRGKDLYTLPWYVIVGEPGSGKTEAIRHSNVGFPPGMQDEFQGVGGTINMNWWFTNQAVLLDTAGRLMFEEVAPGGTSEWKEFLALLKKNRPNCPINGLFLIIPSDSLIKDSADSIAQKAGKIAQQMDVIQRMLDVRFPVFVVVTKCDKTHGFREFFDGLTDPQLQHQIFGWTNPDPLDSPFRPALVDQHLETVAERLRKRRMGLLRDPVPEQNAGRRADEVDSFYSLPHSLTLLAPRLRRYLETIFVAGEWSAKPLFLRGIFFTSSMREGAALDEELANAIGVQVDQLPEGKVWERDRAYFLRDLFLEKVFPEKGLVTNATNTSRMLRRRQATLLGTLAGGLVIFVALAWFGMGSLERNGREQSEYWQVVSKVGWQKNVWKGAIVPPLASGGYDARTTNGFVVDGREFRLGLDEYLKRLQDEAAQPMKGNLLAPGLAAAYNARREKAQRIIFENSVLKPLLDVARQKIMTVTAADKAAASHLPGALASLIRLEAALAARMQDPGAAELTSAEATEFLKSLLRFINQGEALNEAKILPNLASTMVFTYGTNTTGRGHWPPLWAGESAGGTNRLNAYPALRAGISQLSAIITATGQSKIDLWKETTAYQDALAKFKDAEAGLNLAASQADEARFVQHYDTLAKAKAAIDEQSLHVKKLEFSQGQLSLTNLYLRFSALVKGHVASSVEIVKAANEQALKRHTNQMFLEMRAQLQTLENEQSALLSAFESPAASKQLAELDAYFLPQPGYAERWNLYLEGHRARTDTPFANKKLFGRGDELLNASLERVRAIKNQAVAYAGEQKPPLLTTCDFAIKLGEKAQRGGFLDAYLAEINNRIRSQLGFPLVKNLTPALDLKKLVELKSDLESIASDRKFPAFQDAFFLAHNGWKTATRDVDEWHKVAEALLDLNGNPVHCKLFLQKLEPPLEATKDDWRGRYRNIKLNDLPKWMETNVGQDEEIGSAEVDKALTIFISQQDGSGEKHDFQAGPWGPLWLLHSFKGTPGQDPTSWTVEWPVSAAVPKPSVSYKGSVRLTLKFERALPKLENWPSR